MFLVGYFLLAIIVFLVNVVPAFMPPTWIILAFVYLKYHLFFIPTVIIGAMFATFGRVVLYYLAKNHLHIFFPKQSKENLQRAGIYLNKRKKITIPLLILYAFIPIPSNQVYIAAGLANLDIRVMALSFFAGRLISYSFWVGAAKITQNSLEGIFVRHLTRTNTIIAELVGFVLLYLVTIVPWREVFKKRQPSKKTKKRLT